METLIAVIQNAEYLELEWHRKESNNRWIRIIIVINLDSEELIFDLKSFISKSWT